MSRDDLLNTNYKIMSDVVGKAVQYSPNCILDYRVEPARCHGAGRIQAERIFAQSSHWNGGHPGLCTLSHVYRAWN